MQPYTVSHHLHCLSHVDALCIAICNHVSQLPAYGHNNNQCWFSWLSFSQLHALAQYHRLGISSMYAQCNTRQLFRNSLQTPFEALTADLYKCAPWSVPSYWLTAKHSRVDVKACQVHSKLQLTQAYYSVRCISNTVIRPLMKPPVTAVYNQHPSFPILCW